MKILALGDPHGKLPKNLDKIIKKNKIDIIICVGDIPLTPKNPANPKSWIGFWKKANKSYREIIKRLCSYKLPFLTLRGNMYMGDKKLNKFTKSIFSKYKNLYYKKTGKIRIKNQDFVFFDMIFEMHSIRTKRGLRIARRDMKRERKLNKLLQKSRDSILISHSPPYNILDKIHSGKHVGSKILLKSIKRYEPKYVLCGHIHEAKSEKKIGKTKVINLGFYGDYKIIKI